MKPVTELQKYVPWHPQSWHPQSCYEEFETNPEKAIGWFSVQCSMQIAENIEELKPNGATKPVYHSYRMGENR